MSLAMSMLCFTEVQASTPAVIPNDAGEDDDGEPPLNEDDDDDDLDEVDEAEDSNTQHLVLAQFDKVVVLQLYTWNGL